MKVNEKQKIIIVAAVFVVTIGGLVFLNYMKFRERMKLLAEIEKYAQEDKAATEKLKLIPELREKRKKLIDIIDQYAEILPKEEHVQQDAFVNTIDGYRQDTKILIQRAEYVKPKDDAKKKDKAAESFVRHRYRFKLLATVPDFIEFVNKIENHTRFLKVDAINIRPVGTTSDSWEGSGDSKSEDQELARASEPVKEIELTVSTYTYYKGRDKKI